MRNTALSALAGLGVLLVVYGHARGIPLADVPLQRQILPWYDGFTRSIEIIYTFHMPLFFALSGYLLVYSGGHQRGTWQHYLSGKAKRLLLPYVVISSLAYPLKLSLAGFASRPISGSVGGYLEQLLIPWQNSIVFFWFLPTLFLLFVAARALVSEQNQPWRDGLLLILAVIAYWRWPVETSEGWARWLNAGGALHHWIFFLLGMQLRRYRRSLPIALGRPHWAAVLLLATGIFATLVIGCEQPVQAPWMTALTMALAGLCGCVALVNLLSSFGYGRWLNWLGNYSYTIFLLSWFPQVGCRIVFGQMLLTPLWINVLLSFLLGLLVPVLVAQVVQHSVRLQPIRPLIGLSAH